jgi:hypothetical protein
VGHPSRADQERKERIWQKRFYDFNVWRAQKHTEKIKYMHWNPVKRGLVERPEQWPLSSFPAYLYGETAPVRVRVQQWELESSLDLFRILLELRTHSFAQNGNEWGTRQVLYQTLSQNNERMLIAKAGPSCSACPSPLDKADDA